MKQKSFKMLGRLDCKIIEVGRERDPYCMTHFMYKLDCLHCGQLFHTSRPHTRYCTNAHRQQAYRLRKKSQEVTNES